MLFKSLTNQTILWRPLTNSQLMKDESHRKLCFSTFQFHSIQHIFTNLSTIILFLKKTSHYFFPKIAVLIQF